MERTASALWIKKTTTKVVVGGWSRRNETFDPNHLQKYKNPQYPPNIFPVFFKKQPKQ